MKIKWLRGEESNIFPWIQQIAGAEKNAGFQPVINNVLFIHRCLIFIIYKLD